MNTTQIDKLGELLKSGVLGSAELLQLELFRSTFAEAYQHVFRCLVALKFEPTGRPYKSTGSIVAKLSRQPIRLSQMQDVAGVRVIVGDTLAQDRSVESLRGFFDQPIVKDRRSGHHGGYRSVHLIVSCRAKPIELQIRTELQHIWAELSERLADELGAEIKYGGGPAPVQDFLGRLSRAVASLEGEEAPRSFILKELPPPQRRRLERKLKLNFRDVEASYQERMRKFREVVASFTNLDSVSTHDFPD